MDYRNNAFNVAQGTAGVAVDSGLRSFMLGIYNYMASALALTGIVALMVAKLAIAPEAETGALALTPLGQALYMSPLKWVVMFSPLVAILILSMGIEKMSKTAAQAMFWGFAAIMGLSLSSIFLVYTGESIARVFFITAITFGAMSLWGYTTKRDLTGFGSFLIMGAIGIFIAALVNLFLQSSALGFAISVIGVLVFTGLTAYDTQRLKSLYYYLGGNAQAAAKQSIIGALHLYLNFVNAFVMLLQLIGDRR